MNEKLEKVNQEIKATWKRFFRSTIFFVIIFALAFYKFNFKEQKYKEELESTTWYEVVAKYDYSFYHRDREKNGDDYKYVDYYDWHFTYVGHDGKTYDYIEKNQSFEPDKEYTTKIYVDENDDSHSLEIRQYKYLSSAKRLVVLIVITPYFAAYFISFIILYIKKHIIKKLQ